MNTIGVRGKIVVSSDGTGLVCQAGGVLLAETLRVTGLSEGAGAVAGVAGDP